MRSVLSPDPQPLTLPLALALSLHVFVVLFLLCLGWVDLLRPREPIIDLDTVEVSLVEIKQSESMPTRATVAPVPTGEPDVPTPATPPEPPPPRQSDLHLPDPEPEPQPRGAPDRSADREKILREMERKARIAAALEGAKDREATDPTSTADETTSTGGATARGDPELARWHAKVQAIFNQAFNPLPTVVAANPGIEASYNIDFDPVTGEIEGYSPHRPSNNDSYDGAAERAIVSIRTIPPPPERFRDVVGRRLTITFAPD